MQKDLLRLMRDPNLLPSNKQTLLRRIADQAATMGMPCYLVGGFVRDLLLNKPVTDLDIIVEGDAIKLGGALVKKYGGKLTSHPKFRTAIWFYNETDSLDLITARSETYECPGALPTVSPSTIEDDIRRRDFTINAMAVRVDGDHFGELFDPVDGWSDLEQGIVNVLYLRSFINDPTRIFRAVRYEQRYGFKIIRDTLQLINAEALSILAALSGERLRHELDLILNEENASKMLRRLGGLGVLQAIDPNFPSRPKPIEITLGSEKAGIIYDRTTVGYLLWLMDLSPQAITALSRRLDFTSELTQALLSASQLKKDLPNLLNSKPSVWVAALERHPLISTFAVYIVSRERALSDFLLDWRHIKPHTTGDHLKARGIPPGPRYKEILSCLRAAWLDGEIKNENQEEEYLNSLL